ncbi:hypothetical protein J4Q44_G00149990 [Coregonus suidteri]|uniref:Uncharacterized protein n=1 Tax=Coregonus suidteri TaxID=861788 RepID=A0AAN8QT54_9TELE
MHGIGGGGPKRRRCMSPLLRPGRTYTPPVSPAASPSRSPLTESDHTGVRLQRPCLGTSTALRGARETGTAAQPGPGEIRSGPLLDGPGPGNHMEDDGDGDTEEEERAVQNREVEISGGW